MLYRIERAGHWPIEWIEYHRARQATREEAITTSRFTPEAVTYADRVAARAVVIDSRALSELMVRHNIGVQDQHTYVIKRIDEDFFDEG